MSDITRTISIARRRILWDRVVQYVGKALAYALPAALALLLAARLIGLAIPLAWYGLVVLAAIAGAMAFALSRPPRAIDVCVTIDRRLQLKDRMGSAHAIANARTVLPGFAPLVLADAQRLAATLDLRQAIPVRLRGDWSFAGTALVVFALSAWLVPMRQPAPSGPRAAAPAEVLAAQDAIRKQTDEIRQSLDEQPADDSSAEASHAALDEKIAQLDAIAEQLTQHDPSNPEIARARAEASASMNELAEEMAARSERELEALDELARRFEGLDRPAGENAIDPQLQKFLDSMAQGEFDRAAEALDEATDAAQSGNDEAKRDLADEMRTLSEQLEHMAREQDAPAAGDEVATPETSPERETAEAREDDVRQALEDLGKSPEEIEQMLDPKQPKPQDQQQGERDTEQDLRDAGADDELAEKLARDIEQMRKERDTRERADEKAKDIADAMRRQADSIEQPKQQQQGEQEQKQGEEQSSEQQSGEQKPGEQEQQIEREQPSQSGEQRQGTKPDPGAEREAEQQSPTDTPSEQQVEQREGDSEQQMPGSQQDPHAEQKPGEVPQPAESQSPPRDAPSMMRELQRMREEADRSREQSERLKERARELADTLSPEERKALERWAEAQQREQSPPPEEGEGRGTPDSPRTTGSGQAPGTQPGSTELGPQPTQLETDPTSADLHDQGNIDGRKIGEMPGDDELIIDPENRAAAARRNIEAQRAAQRAIEQGEVPARYHRFIQRYFRQFNPEKIPRGGAESTEGKN